MALAKRKNQEVEETETQETTQTPALALADASNGEAQETQPKRRGGPRGPRTKPAFQWTPEKQKALLRAMKKIEASGLPVTMGNILHTLQTDPAFAEDVAAETLDQSKVNAFLNKARAAFEEAGKDDPFPELARSKRTSVALDALLAE